MTEISMASAQSRTVRSGGGSLPQVTVDHSAYESDLDENYLNGHDQNSYSGSKYARKLRRKTRSNRYDFLGREAGQRISKKVAKDRTAKNCRKEQRAPGIAECFTAPNITASRLTLNRTARTGLHRSSMIMDPAASHDLPDLTFSSMSFLSKSEPRGHGQVSQSAIVADLIANDDLCDPRVRPQGSKRTRQHAQQKELENAHEYSQLKPCSTHVGNRHERTVRHTASPQLRLSSYQVSPCHAVCLQHPCGRVVSSRNRLASQSSTDCDQDCHNKNSERPCEAAILEKFTRQALIGKEPGRWRREPTHRPFHDTLEDPQAQKIQEERFERPRNQTEYSFQSQIRRKEHSPRRCHHNPSSECHKSCKVYNSTWLEVRKSDCHSMSSKDFLYNGPGTPQKSNNISDHEYLDYTKQSQPHCTQLETTPSACSQIASIESIDRVTGYETFLESINHTHSSNYNCRKATQKPSPDIHPDDLSCTDPCHERMGTTSPGFCSCSFDAFDRSLLESSDSSAAANFFRATETWIGMNDDVLDMANTDVEMKMIKPDEVFPPEFTGFLTPYLLF